MSIGNSGFLSCAEFPRFMVALSVLEYIIVLGYEHGIPRTRAVSQTNITHR